MNKKRRVGFCVLFFALLILMVIVPLIVHCCSSKTKSEITADGLLEYLGNCLVTIPTIVLAVYAIWQTKKANELSLDSNNKALKAIELAERANKISEEVIELNKAANGISDRLLHLEEFRQDLELRPSFAVCEWHSPKKGLNETCIFPECFSVQVGKYSKGTAWGIELNLINTSSGFETISYVSGRSKSGKIKWMNSMSGMSSRQIGLMPSEKEKIYFFADKEFWDLQKGEKITLEFLVKNRIDISYRERFDLWLFSMNEDVVHVKNNEPFLFLEVSNYRVGKVTKYIEDYPDGVIWEDYNES